MRFNLVENDTFSVDGEIVCDRLCLHIPYIKKWSASTYKAMLEALDSIKVSAKDQGLEYVYAIVPEGNTKIGSIFGFSAKGVLLSGLTKSQYVLMEQAT